MTAYVNMLLKMTDEQLAEALAGPMPGSTNHELIKFEVQRRAYVAQKLAAEATVRSAQATERYTLATWLLLAVTVAGFVVSLFRP